MAIIQLSHNNHLSEVLDHNLRSKISTYGIDGAFGSLVDSNYGRAFTFIQAQFIPMKE